MHRRISARLRLVVAGALVAAFVSLPSMGQELRFLRIGTGGTGGTYFPVGGLIANAISNPPGSRACDVGGSCGVPGLIAAAVSTQGSVDNVRGLGAGTLNLALCQADVAYDAYFGKGVFAKDGAMDGLRAIANLYPEPVHVVARRDAGLATVGDLKGKRVNMGQKASGTIVVANIVLGAYGLSEKSVKPFYEELGTAGDMLVAGTLDAFFMVGGAPLSAVLHTADQVEIVLLPIAGTEAARIKAAYPFLASDTIAEGIYKNVGAVETLAVGAQLVASTALDNDLAYGIARALWHPNNRRLIDSGHPKGRLIQLDTALNGIAIPLHPGAARFYEEVGLTRADVF